MIGIVLVFQVRITCLPICESSRSFFHVIKIWIHISLKVTLHWDLPRPSIPAAVDVAGKSASVEKRGSGPFQCLQSCRYYMINETWCRHLLLGQKSLWLLGLSLAYYLQTSPTFGMGSQLFSPSDWTHSRIKPHTHGQHIGRYELHTILIIGEFV